MTSAKKNALRLAKILDILEGDDPPPRPGLNYLDPWELVVATLLSAQCTDNRVNIVTGELFKLYPDPAAMANAEIGELEDAIRSIGLFRNKAKNLKAMAELVVNKHGGKVPDHREGLEALPGVGHKTASVVLSHGFDVPAFAVDTHVGRLSMRMGFAKSKDPALVEKKMTALIPSERWTVAHLLLIRHGRTTCKARKPLCNDCQVEELCPGSLKE